MENQSSRFNQFTNTCSLMGVKPIMVDLPYPETRVREKNTSYANLLSVDYCGSVSELSAIAQYINHENRMSCQKCPLIQTILGIAMAEMIHLQKLGEMIFLLGGDVDFTARYHDRKPRMWTPEGLCAAGDIRQMLLSDIEAEKGAVKQYTMHMRMINDEYVKAVLARIVMDENYHIMLLETLLEEGV